jgi:hypothetical protein
MELRWEIFCCEREQGVGGRVGGNLCTGRKRLAVEPASIDGQFSAYRLGPSDIAGGVGHQERALEVVGVDPERAGRAASVGDDRDRPVLQPDIFRHQVAGGVVFGDDVAVEIVHAMHHADARLDVARDQPVQVVVGVGAPGDAVSRDGGDLAGMVPRQYLRLAVEDVLVLGQVARGVIAERPRCDATGRHALQPLGAGVPIGDGGSCDTFRIVRHDAVDFDGVAAL